MMKPIRRVALATLVAASGGAHAHGDRHAAAPPKQEQKDWGIAGERSAVTRTIEIGMHDRMRFAPDRIEVREGETVRLVHRNRGRVMHEFVLGTSSELAGHAALMKRFPTMEHDEPYMAHVAAGGTGEIVWTFNRVGSFAFACLIPGHYDAGMVGRVVVLPAPAADAARYPVGAPHRARSTTQRGPE